MRKRKLSRITSASNMRYFSFASRVALVSTWNAIWLKSGLEGLADLRFFGGLRFGFFGMAISVFVIQILIQVILHNNSSPLNLLNCI